MTSMCVYLFTFTSVWNHTISISSVGDCGPPRPCISCVPLSSRINNLLFYACSCSEQPTCFVATHVDPHEFLMMGEWILVGLQLRVRVWPLVKETIYKLPWNIINGVFLAVCLCVCISICRPLPDSQIVP